MAIFTRSKPTFKTKTQRQKGGHSTLKKKVSRSMLQYNAEAVVCTLLCQWNILKRMHVWFIILGSKNMLGRCIFIYSSPGRWVKKLISDTGSNNDNFPLRFWRLTLWRFWCCCTAGPLTSTTKTPVEPEQKLYLSAFLLHGNSRTHQTGWYANTGQVTRRVSSERSL